MKNFALATVASLAMAGAAQAAFLIEIDTDAADDGVLTFNSNFGFGGDTTTASQSAASSAFGMTGGDSIFGGNGNLEPDTYVYTYTPGVDADNLVVAAGTALSSGSVATGIVGGGSGGSGGYSFYATWPATTNVSGGLVTFEIVEQATNNVLSSVQVDQNGTGDVWTRIGSANLTAGTTYEIRQIAGANTFVSMRAAGVLIEVPEPASAALLGLGGLAALRRRSA
jgi:hypothetical protein